MPPYFVTGPALIDLARIWDYHFNIANALVADREVARLYDLFMLLAEYPYMGTPHPEQAPEIRSHVASGTSYVVWYYPVEGQIEIVRVVHGRRDIGRLFQ